MLPAWPMFRMQRSLFGKKKLQAHEMIERKDGNVRQVGAVHHLGLQLDIAKDTVHSVTGQLVRSLAEVLCGPERSLTWWIEQEDDRNGLRGEEREVANAFDCGVQLGVEKRGRRQEQEAQVPSWACVASVRMHLPSDGNCDVVCIEELFYEIVSVSRSNARHMETTVGRDGWRK